MLMFSILVSRRRRPERKPRQPVSQSVRCSSRHTGSFVFVSSENYTCQQHTAVTTPPTHEHEHEHPAKPTPSIPISVLPFLSFNPTQPRPSEQTENLKSQKVEQTELLNGGNGPGVGARTKDERSQEKTEPKKKFNNHCLT
jgi:uncharacterized protein with LGFP repeats